jgi:hypothetical protein
MELSRTGPRLKQISNGLSLIWRGDRRRLAQMPALPSFAQPKLGAKLSV